MVRSGLFVPGRRTVVFTEPVSPRLPPILKSVPDPLLRELIAGRWLPVIGAGLSKNAVLPPGASMPDWRQLGARLGEQLPSGYASDSPLENISAYEHEFGPNKLIDTVQRELHVTDARPGKIHAAFCNLPFDVVVTTNVEQLLEVQYRARYGSVLQVIEQEQLRLSNPYSSPNLVKLHGDLQHPSSLVLTESDYDSFLDRRPLFATWLANQLITKTGVLIGYSLDDPDFRAVLAWLHARLGSVPPDLYVFEVDASAAKIARYERRKIRVVNIRSRGQGWRILGQLFDELAEYWEKHAPARVTANTTIGKTILRAQERVNRVVLFIVDRSRVGDYDENVFPVLIDQGLIPITEEDIFVPPGNQVAAMDLLLRAASQVVVEVGQPDDPQLERAARSVGRERVLVVKPAESDEGEEGHRWWIHGPASTRHWESFANRLTDLLQEQRRSLREVVRDENRTDVSSFLGIGQDQKAFLLGVVELEGRLNRLFRSELIAARSRSRPASLRSLLELARDAEMIEISSAEIARLADGRNRAAHGQPIPARELKTLAELVSRLLDPASGGIGAGE